MIYLAKRSCEILKRNKMKKTIIISIVFVFVVFNVMNIFQINQNDNSLNHLLKASTAHAEVAWPGCSTHVDYNSEFYGCEDEGAYIDCWAASIYSYDEAGSGLTYDEGIVQFTDYCDGRREEINTVETYKCLEF